eukprot:gene8498-biopygen97
MQVLGVETATPASGPRPFLQLLLCAPRSVRVRCRFPLCAGGGTGEAEGGAVNSANFVRSAAKQCRRRAANVRQIMRCSQKCDPLRKKGRSNVSPLWAPLRLLACSRKGLDFLRARVGTQQSAARPGPGWCRRKGAARVHLRLEATAVRSGMPFSLLLCGCRFPGTAFGGDGSQSASPCGHVVSCVPPDEGSLFPLGEGSSALRYLTLPYPLHDIFLNKTFVPAPGQKYGGGGGQAQGSQDTGAGMARAWRGLQANFGLGGAGMARAWRGHVL